MSFYSVLDEGDWEFDGGEFTICNFSYIDKNGEPHIEQCFCKNWTECKGFKNEDRN